MKVGVYLTFDGDCKEAFDFYKGVFGGEFTWVGTFGGSPMKDTLPEDKHDKIMHISLPLSNSVDLMGSDHAPGMHKSALVKGTNKQISLSPDSKDETDRLFRALSAGGSEDQPLKDMFWGSYFGYCTDKFGVRWMFDFATSKASAKDQITSTAKELRAVSKTALKAAERLDALEVEGHPPSKKQKADDEKKVDG